MPVFLGEISEKIQNSHSKFIPVFLGKIVRKNLEWGHSKFISVFLGKIAGKNLEWANFGHSEFIPVFLRKIGRKNLKQSFWEILSEKIWNGHFWPFQISSSHFGTNGVPVFLGKIVGKNSEWPFLAISNLYQSFWGKLLKTIQNGHSKFIQVFLGKIVRKYSEWPF